MGEELGVSLVDGSAKLQIDDAEKATSVSRVSSSYKNGHVHSQLLTSLSSVGHDLLWGRG